MALRFGGSAWTSTTSATSGTVKRGGLRSSAADGTTDIDTGSVEAAVRATLAH